MHDSRKLSTHLQATNPDYLIYFHFVFYWSQRSAGLSDSSKIILGFRAWKYLFNSILSLVLMDYHAEALGRDWWITQTHTHTHTHTLSPLADVGVKMRLKLKQRWFDCYLVASSEHVHSWFCALKHQRSYVWFSLLRGFLFLSKPKSLIQHLRC